MPADTFEFKLLSLSSFFLCSGSMALAKPSIPSKFKLAASMVVWARYVLWMPAGYTNYTRASSLSGSHLAAFPPRPTEDYLRRLSLTAQAVQVGLALSYSCPQFLHDQMPQEQVKG
ncbi:hypothetical protein K438DRAFT_26137 [Mycena galopus ATCC 62051]|nr:hypothetical protein K438DRAFT_26137 [Mycena galopus ATCC 62051]